MAFVPVPFTAMVELIYDYFGEVCENTLYFRGSVDWTAIDMTTLATEVQAWWVANYAPLVSNSLTLQRVKVTDIASQTGGVIEKTSGLPAAGGISASPGMPGNVALAVSFRTAGRGRHQRGRNFVLGITEAQAAGNEIAGATQAAWVSAYNALFAAVTVNAADWVVVSRFFNKAPRSTGATYVVTHVLADDALDSQRRRLQGRGR